MSWCRELGMICGFFHSVFVVVTSLGALVLRCFFVCRFLTFAVAESLSTACTRQHPTTPLFNAESKRESRQPPTTGALVCAAAHLPALRTDDFFRSRRALEDASIIEQSLRSELQRTRITAGSHARS